MNDKTCGYFIHRRPFSTKAVLLTLFTKEEGASKYLVYPSKKHPPLIPFMYYELEFKASSQFHSVQRMSLVKNDCLVFSTPFSRCSFLPFVKKSKRPIGEKKIPGIPGFVKILCELILRKPLFNFIVVHDFFLGGIRS